MKLLTILALLTSFPLFADTTGTLNLQGIVPSVLSVEVNPEAIATNLDLAQTAVNLKIGTIIETSNTKDSYNIVITSLNDCNLKRVGGIELFPYTLNFLSSQVSSGESISRSNFGISNSDLNISYSGINPEDMVSGVYSDTLVVEIIAN